MPEIRILADQVANQIAAGEVVERPVAVLKELVENSIDAGAQKIEIEFRNGGKSYLRVEDDGCGMKPDQALLALERHATSKIRKASDLNKVGTFGFRGEALPSIASVSRFVLRTRSKSSQEGTEIFVNGGKMIHCKECGMPQGPGWKFPICLTLFLAGENFSRPRSLKPLILSTWLNFMPWLILQSLLLLLRGDVPCSVRLPAIAH